MGWADGGGSSPISVKNGDAFGPRVPWGLQGSDSPSFPDSSVHVLKLGVPQASVLPNFHSPLMVTCCWGRSVQGAGAGGMGSPPVSSPCNPRFFFSCDQLLMDRHLPVHYGALLRASLVVQMIENLPANAGDTGLIPGLG